MENIKGEIQNIKDNNFAINNIWFNNKFLKLPEEIKKGSIVSVDYIIKDKKNYWKKITIEKQIEPKKQVIKEKINNESEIPYQVKDTILMCSKEILVTEINKGYKFDKEEFETKLKWLVKIFKQCYYDL